MNLRIRDRVRLQTCRVRKPQASTVSAHGLLTRLVESGRRDILHRIVDRCQVRRLQRRHPLTFQIVHCRLAGLLRYARASCAPGLLRDLRRAKPREHPAARVPRSGTRAPEPWPHGTQRCPRLAFDSRHAAGPRWRVRSLSHAGPSHGQVWCWAGWPYRCRGGARWRPLPPAG